MLCLNLIYFLRIFSSPAHFHSGSCLCIWTYYAICRTLAWLMLAATISTVTSLMKLSVLLRYHSAALWRLASLSVRLSYVHWQPKYFFVHVVESAPSRDQSSDSPPSICFKCASRMTTFCQTDLQGISPLHHHVLYLLVFHHPPSSYTVILSLGCHTSCVYILLHRILVAGWETNHTKSLHPSAISAYHLLFAHLWTLWYHQRTYWPNSWCCQTYHWWTADIQVALIHCPAEFHL